MAMLNETQSKVLAYLVNLLEDNGILYQISGGLGAIAYGADRPLFDIDLEIYAKDVEKVRALLRDYITEDWNHDLGGPNDQFDLWMMTLCIDGVPVDINQIEGSRVRAVGGIWVNQPETMEIEMREVEGISVPVQKKEDLIAYKKVLARDTDLVDVEQIS